MPTFLSDRRKEAVLCDVGDLNAFEYFASAINKHWNKACQVCNWSIRYHLCSTYRGFCGLVVVQWQRTYLLFLSFYFTLHYQTRPPAEPHQTERRVALSPGHSQIYLAAAENFESSLGTCSRSSQACCTLTDTQHRTWPENNWKRGSTCPLEGNHRSAFLSTSHWMERRLPIWLFLLMFHEFKVYWIRSLQSKCQQKWLMISS